MRSATGAPCDNTCSTSTRAPCRARYSAISAPGSSPCRPTLRSESTTKSVTELAAMRKGSASATAGLTAGVPADQYLVADRLGFPAARYDENGSAAGEKELFGRCVALELLQLTLTDYHEIGMKRVESEILITSTSTYHPELSTEIALCGNFFEAPANDGGHGVVGRFLRGSRGADGRANHIVIGSMLRATCRYDVNPGKVGTALMGQCSCIVGPLLSFGGRVDEDLNVFQSHCISPVGDQSACGEARLGDTDWFNRAVAISRLKASRVPASYLSRLSRRTSGSTRAQAAAFTRRASSSLSPSRVTSPDALASVRIFAMRRTRSAS